jgi:hypothetical protein
VPSLDFFLNFAYVHGRLSVSMASNAACRGNISPRRRLISEPTMVKATSITVSVSTLTPFSLWTFHIFSHGCQRPVLLLQTELVYYFVYSAQGFPDDYLSLGTVCL